MPQYVAKVRTDMPPDVAFAYMSDLRNFEEWDPGVEAVSQVEGNGPGANAVYDVSVSAKMVTMTFRYTTTDYDPPRRLRVYGTWGVFESVDIVEVAPAEEGSIVTYDATLTLRPPLSLGDGLLTGPFERIGDRAASGLAAKLDGSLVT